MARKDESLLDLLALCPWWVSVLASGIAFVFPRFILPLIEFQNMVVNSIAKGLSIAAPFLALILLIPAPISALRSWKKGRRLDSQKDIDSIRALNWREFEELIEGGDPRVRLAISQLWIGGAQPQAVRRLAAKYLEESL
jgi:restriction system protein